MTLDDAIAILKQEARLAKVYNKHMGKPAIKLGIEALKYVKRSRDPHGVPSYEPLLGETE